MCALVRDLNTLITDAMSNAALCSAHDISTLQVTVTTPIQRPLDWDYPGEPVTER